MAVPNFLAMTKEELSSRYLLAVDEIHQNVSVKKSLEEIKDDFFDFLVDAYLFGVDNVNEMLGTNDRADLDEIEEALFFLIDGETYEDRIEKHYAAADQAGMEMLAESEFHRVYNTGAENTALRNHAWKEWLTMLDDKVRDTHSYLEGEMVPVGEEFYTFDGDHALYPGGFQTAQNNAGCRCILWYTAT